MARIAAFFAFLKAAWNTAWAIWRFIKDLDRQGVERFSDEWSLGFRRRLIARIIAMEAGNEKGWRKWFETDDQFLRSMKIIFKSDTLGESLGEKSIRDARKLLTDAMGEFGKLSVYGPQTYADATTIRDKIIAAGEILTQKDPQPK